MANIKISELNPLLTVEDADVLPIVDNAVTKKVTAAILRSYTQGNSVLLTGAQTVAGIKTFTSQLASSVATGTAPFSVASTTKVTNLNADLLDGLSSADFQATLSGTGIVKSTAGTISYLTDNSANWNTAFNDSITSAAVTGTTTKLLTLNQQDGGTITASWTDDNTDAVTSVFGRTGEVVAAEGDYTTTQVTEGTNLYYTEARVNANTNVAANTAARHNAVTLGTANGLSLSTQALSLALASGSTTGALSSTDWTTFNNKQNALTNPITGTGTTNYLPKFTGASALGNSVIYDDGTNIGLGTATPSQKLEVVGNILVRNTLTNASFYLAQEGDNSSTLYQYNNGTLKNVLATNGVSYITGGNVGIGTTNPDVFGRYYSGTILGISSAGQSAFQLNSASGNGAYFDMGVNGTRTFNIFSESTSTDIASLGSRTLGISTNGAARLFIQANGNIGVNTTTDAGYKLDVNGTARIATNLELSNGTLFVSNGSGNAYSSSLSTVNSYPLIQTYLDSNGGTSWEGRLYFRTSSNGGALTTQLTIEHSGAATFSASVTTGADATINGVTVGRGVGSIVSNTALGQNPLASNTTGYKNTAIGQTALYLNTTGSDNTAVGFQSLYFNSTGTFNSGLGENSLFYNTTGSNNTAIGYYSLFNNTASNNTAVGFEAGFSNTSGTYISAVGYQALKGNTTGINNTANGGFALFQNTTGTNNTSVGYASLYSNTTGSNNTAFGSGALFQNTASNNTAVGAESASSNTTGNYIVSLGYQALKNSNANGNTAIGYQSLISNIDASYNTALGSGTDSANFSGSIILGVNATATNNNQFVVGSSSVNAGSVSTEVNASTKVWNVIINGVAQKILLA